MRRILFLLLLLDCAKAAPSPDRWTLAIDLYASPSSPRFLVGDVDGDRAPDIVIAFGEPTTDRGIALRHGDGRGGFGDLRRILFGTASMTLFDVDADGRDDLIVNDGQNLGLLHGAKGPMEVIAHPKEPIVLQADREGAWTSDGTTTLTLHTWSAEKRSLDSTPLVPTLASDVDGDGVTDLIGSALGYAAIRRGCDGSTRILGAAPHVSASHGFPIPKGVIAIATDSAMTIVATKERLTMVEPDSVPIDGPWKDIHQIEIVGKEVFVSDWGAAVIAVIHLL
jgi:FG-GAP-like repeat